MMDADARYPGLPVLCAKTAVVHTLTYFLMGILAYTLMDYRTAFASPTMICWMRQVDDPAVAAGGLFQPLRGVLFALAIFPIREVIFGKKYGWLILGWLFVALGILGTFGPAPGSFEGFIFTKIPGQYKGWLEVVPQALLLSAILVYWSKHPEKKGLTWTLSTVFVLLMASVVWGLLLRK